MSARERTAAFLQIAEEEISAARALCAGSRRQAAYFCQQAAEKIARAVLNEAGVPFGTGHNLSQMAFALPADHPWRPKLNALDKHSPAATRYRYPGPTGRLFDAPSTEQIRRDIDELVRLLDEARQICKPGQKEIRLGYMLPEPGEVAGAGCGHSGVIQARHELRRTPGTGGVS